MTFANGNWRRWLTIAFCCGTTAVFIGAFSVRGTRHPDRVSLVLTGYRKRKTDPFPYAKVQLINRTTNIIRYPQILDGSLTAAVIVREHTSTGWTAAHWASRVQGSTMVLQPLKPGKSVDLIVPLISGGPASRIAIPCEDVPEVERSGTAIQVRRWAVPIGRLLGIAITPPEFLSELDKQIWCEETIVVPNTYDDRETE